MTAVHSAQWVWSALLASLLIGQSLAEVISKEALYVELARQARAELAAMPHLSTHSATAHFRSVIAKGFVRHGHSESDVEVRGLPSGVSCKCAAQFGRWLQQTTPVDKTAVQDPHRSVQDRPHAGAYDKCEEAFACVLYSLLAVSQGIHGYILQKRGISRHSVCVVYS